MKRRREASGFDGFCSDAIDFLRSTRMPFLVIGGLAVIALGQPRTTADLDVVGYATDQEARTLLALGRARGFRVASDELARMQATGTLRFHRGHFQLDIILASLPFEQAARRRAMRKRLFGRMVPLPTPEDLILFKVIAGRPQDMVDAVGVARRHLPGLDRRYLRRTIDQICDLAEDHAPRTRLERVLAEAAEGSAGRRARTGV